MEVVVAAFQSVAQAAAQAVVHPVMKVLRDHCLETVEAYQISPLPEGD
jgi:hypothetical protein